MSERFTLPNRPLDWGASPHDFTGNNQLGIYTAETTQRFVHGTRYITWDGRVYKYMLLTTGGGVSYHGVASTSEAPQSYTANAVERTAGDRFVDITKTSVTEDLYAGGMVSAYMATIDNTTNHHIIGNDASGATYTRLYIEFPLPANLTTSDAFEVFSNPYRAVSESTYQYGPWVGIPCVTAATTNNIWAQTWGPALVSPVNTSLDDAAANERMTFWAANAGILEVDAATGAGKNQVAGYILNAGTGGIAGPQIYLMCST